MTWYHIEKAEDGSKKVICIMDEGRLLTKCFVKSETNDIDQAVSDARRGAEENLNQLRKAVLKLEGK